MTSPGALRIIFSCLSAVCVSLQVASFSSETTIPREVNTAAHYSQLPPKSPGEFAKQIPKLPASPMELKLTADTETPITDQNVHFTVTWNQSVQRPSYRFDWGDGHYSDESLPQSNHSYPAPGNYAVHVVAKALFDDRTSEFRSNELTINVSPTPPPEQLPLPTLTSTPAQARVGESVTFIAAIDPRVGPPQYQFYFDDGTNSGSETNQIVHTYERPGTYHPYVSASLGHGDAIVTGSPIQLTVESAVVPAQVPNPGNKAKIAKPATGHVRLPEQQDRWSRTLLRAVVLIVLLGVGAAFISRLFRHSKTRPKSTPEFRVVCHPDTGSQQFSLGKQAAPHISLTFVPGADLAEHRITFL